MPKKVSRVEATVEDCLKKLVKHYEEQEEDFLTEGDVASSLFYMLKYEMEKQNVEGFKVHVGLRPYKELKLVLKAKDTAPEEWEWKEHYPKNSGAVVDIAIISTSPKYFDKAKENSKDILKKYWRLVTYPLEAFAVCIEVKIRVSGNKKRIEKDIKKLYEIRKANENCLVYLVVVDRKASDISIKNIKNFCDANGVPLHIAVPSYQT